MIGNDIIDLVLARKESHWKRKKFLHKLFTQEEQLLIANARNPEIMVWNLWSRKEAAYKIYNRETGIRAYIPLQLVCFYENENAGTVCCNDRVYHTKTTVTTDFIYTIAVFKSDFFNQIKKISLDANINKKNGIPFLTDPHTKLSKAVSITHHGRFWEGISL